jgi:hypothetical protein
MVKTQRGMSFLLVLATALSCASIGTNFTLPAAAADAESTAPVSYMQLYPQDVSMSEDGAIIKTYALRSGESPSLIPTSDLTENGTRYVLADIMRESVRDVQTIPFKRTVEFETTTNKADEIIAMISPKSYFTTQDGFSGDVPSDLRTIRIEPVTASGSKTKTFTREFPAFSGADTDSIPKQISDNGTSYSLEDISWIPSSVSPNPDDYEQQNTGYTAVATYKGSYMTSYVKGYKVSVDFTGEVSKVTGESDIYKAVFRQADPIPVSKGPNLGVILAILALLVCIGLSIMFFFAGKKKKENEGDEEKDDSRGGGKSGAKGGGTRGPVRETEGGRIPYGGYSPPPVRNGYPPNDYQRRQ